ncbi:MAG TPA: type IV pilus assembly protein PilM [Candidatus Krumholzibacteria bacterium]|nr:type IV pilus assembly protein PilM [Candidatus Krumholzibacteria bacterium]
MLPMLRKRSKSTVALDIGSSVVKCLRVDHSSENPLVTHFAMVDLVPEAIVDGEIMDRDMVVEAVRECIGRAGVPETQVVSAIGGRSVIVKKILMDKMAAADAQEAILWEAEQHVPFDIDDISLDFQIVKDDVGADQMEILLVAARRDTIQSHAELLREADLNPVIVDVHSFALQNCYEEITGGPSEEVVGLLNVGSETTNVAIVQNGVPYFTRDLTVGTNRLVEEFQKRFGMNDDDARQAVANPTAQEDLTAEALLDAVTDVADEISTGVERSLSFLRTSGDAETIDRLVLSGGGGSFPGLADYLKERHEIDVDVSDPLGSIEYDPEIFEDADVERVSPLLTVGLGLGLRKVGDKQ